MVLKTCFDLDAKANEQFGDIMIYDEKEIDNVDQHDPRRLLYLDRIRRVVSVVTSQFPDVTKSRIGELGCAQGNMSLLLGELGYSVVALDINHRFLEYSRLKHERGDIRWVVGDIDRPGMRNGIFDVVVLGEVIEHCAYPEDIIEKSLSHIRPGGMLILTTPNGSRIRTRLATFRDALSRYDREYLERRQFGPDGKDHLFLFTLDEIGDIVPGNAEIVDIGYSGSTILINKYSAPMLRLVPVGFVEWTIRALAKIPVLNRKTYNSLYAVIRRAN
ncbi:MAG: hypothetical protein CL878_07115 [Dehalococcoidia bacterium]|nr:hypothetical protein [Dehalococcoidia bacterium]